MSVMAEQRLARLEKTGLDELLRIHWPENHLVPHPVSLLSLFSYEVAISPADVAGPARTVYVCEFAKEESTDHKKKAPRNAH